MADGKPGAKLKFPVPEDYKLKHRVVFCPSVRVLGLYNQEKGTNAKKIAKKVKAWFRSTAIRKGWTGSHFLPEVPTGSGAGCVLWMPPRTINVSITVTEHVLVLQAETE